MNKVTELLKSRKFWMTVAAVTSSIASAVSGEIEWPQAMNLIIASVSAWVVAQGWVDAKDAERAKALVETAVEMADKVVAKTTPLLLAGVLLAVSGCVTTTVVRQKTNYIDEIRLMQVANERDAGVLMEVIEHAKDVNNRVLCLAAAERLQVNLNSTKWRLMTMLKYADESVDPGPIQEVPPAEYLCPVADFAVMQSDISSPSSSGDDEAASVASEGE